MDRFRTELGLLLGARFADDQLPLLREVLDARMRASGCVELDAYLARVRSVNAELAEIARRTTVTETYFLRDANQFLAFEALASERTSAGKPLRLLSAGCSSGEEAYSLAISLLWVLPDLRQAGVSITGVDINPDALEKARRGRYSAWSLRGVPDDFAARYLRRDGKEYVIESALREAVRFEPGNLARPELEFWRPDSFDVIFCRNVLMYFVPEVARGVVARLAGALAPDGHLFLGHAENLRGLSSDFHLVHSHGTFYYRRRAAGASVPSHELESDRVEPRARVEPAPELSDDWHRVIADASSRIEGLTRARDQSGVEPQEAPRSLAGSGHLGPALLLLGQDRFRDALAILPAPPAEADTDALLLRAVLLLGNGEAAEAERVCASLLGVDDLNAGAHYVLSLCRDHAGDTDGAVEHAQVAAYLDPEFAMPHLQLGLLARRAGKLGPARRELGLALELLAREDASRVVLFGGGFRRHALIQLCRAEISQCEGRA